MNSGKAKNLVGVAMMFTVGVGVVNSIAKNQTLPSARFIIGSSVVWLILTAVADVEPEIAVPLAVAVLTTSILASDSGPLDWLTKRGETPTSKPDAKNVNPDAAFKGGAAGDVSSKVGAASVAAAGASVKFPTQRKRPAMPKHATIN